MFVFNPIGEVVIHMGTTTSPSFITIKIKTKKVLLIAHFLNFEFLIHLLDNSLIFPNSLLDDPALNHYLLILFEIFVKSSHILHRAK